jgi:1-acyl-sn-glycerol-3-phosphate acyltransferase
MAEDKSQLGDYVTGFQPPSKDFVRRLTAAARIYFDPVFVGLDAMDASRPALYVTNHNVTGTLDGVLWASELYLVKDIFCRSLVDDFHYKIPGWRDLGANVMGFVRGSRENCDAMMEHGEHIIVYPGGARETCKRKGEQHGLTWKERTGFARMAIRHGYDIITVAQVGADDAFDIVADTEDIMGSRFGQWLKSSGLADKFFKGGDTFPPLVRGIGPTLLPRPERQFCGFGNRISTTAYAGRADDKEALWELRTIVEQQMELDMLKLRIMKLEQTEKTGLRALLNSL